MVQSCIDTVQMILSDWPDTGGGTTEKKSFMAVLGVIADNYCIYRASDKANKITSQSVFKIISYIIIFKIAENNCSETKERESATFEKLTII